MNNQGCLPVRGNREPSGGAGGPRGESLACPPGALPPILLPAHVQRVMERLERGGREAYVVGGCVRDLLMGRAPKDWDVCTDAPPEEVAGLFADAKVAPTGVRHGTVTVVADHLPVEVTTYRVDGAYSDHRRPDRVCFTPSLEADLARRDFTINAMAYAPSRGLVDGHGGREDLKAGLVRCVGEPAARFSEDALRILRALRFATRFGFAIEEGTAGALLARREDLRYVAVERILMELQGMDFGRMESRFLPVLQIVLPELAALPAQRRLPPDPAVRLAYLLWGLDARAILTRLKAGNDLRERVALLAAEPEEKTPADTVSIRRTLRRLGPEAAAQLFTLQQNKPAQKALEAALARGECYSLATLAVNGRDLKARGLSGERIGRTLERMLAAVVDGELPNEKEALLGARGGFI